MIATHIAWLHAEAEGMIENERRRDLSLLYPLLRPLPSGLTPVVQKLIQHITQQGLQAIGSLQGENVRKVAIASTIPYIAKVFSHSIISLHRYIYTSWRACWTCIKNIRT